MIGKNILNFIEENDVKFVRLGFCDPMGNHKNISIMSNELERAFSDGVSFDAGAISAFSDVSSSDLLLFPDASTLTLLPWRPYTNAVLRFYCYIKNPDMTPFLGDGRLMLQNAINDLADLGLNCKFGTECEFYLFKTDEDEMPTLKTIDNGGYLDISPRDKGENIRREICLCLEEMGLNPEKSHHEQGPGQNEIDFKFSDAMTSADNILTFKSVVKSIAGANGLFASFMPKPFSDKSGSGMHLNISLYKDGKNLFSDTKSKDYKYAQYFMAGIMDKIREITLFLNPTNNSYERLGAFEAPKYISWSRENRSQLIRVPVAGKNRERIELRSPDASLNPYVAFSLIIQAGIEGIKKKMELPKSTDLDLYNADKSVTEKLSALPENLGEAIKLANGSKFVKKNVDNNLLSKFIYLKEREFKEYTKAKDKVEYYISEYFDKL